MTDAHFVPFYLSVWGLFFGLVNKKLDSQQQHLISFIISFCTSFVLSGQ